MSRDPLVVSVESNVAVNLFRGEDWKSGRIMKLLHGGGIVLVVTELALAQSLPTTAKYAWDRFRRIAEFSRTVGLGWFRIGAPLYMIMESELRFPDRSGPRWVDAYPDQVHLSTMALADGPFDTFAAYHAKLMNDLYDSNAEKARDWEHREKAKAAFGLGTKDADEAWLKDKLQRFPSMLCTDNLYLETTVKDANLRARVLAEPHRCPTITALVLGLSLNTLGACAHPHDIEDFRDLKIAKDSWNDVRVMAESASADVFATGDVALTARANRLKAWNFYTPRIATWEEIVAERCRPTGGLTERG